MKTTGALFGCLLLCMSLPGAERALIVTDFSPAMEMLSDKLNIVDKIPTQVVRQSEMGSDLSGYSAVIVHIRSSMTDAAEKALIAYAQEGGKLIVLHRSISANKRRNQRWLTALGVALPEGRGGQGGPKWTIGVTQTIVNLAPDHFITTNLVAYPEQTAFRCEGEGDERMRPCFTLRDSAICLDRALEGPRKPLLGVKYTDKESGRTYMQAQAGWLKRYGRGWIIYLEPGHSVREIENPVYGQILLNAVLWRP